MFLNLNDPDSIVQWWESYPERHWGYLEVFAERSPQFRAAILQARQRIRSDARLQPLLARATRAVPASLPPEPPASEDGFEPSEADDWAPKYGGSAH